MGPHKKQVLQVGVLIVLVNVLDLLSTWVASPNLHGEWNVLHRVLQWGWSGLIGAKVIGVTLAVAGYAYYLQRRPELFPTCPMPIGEFCRVMLFGQQGTDVRHLLALAGYMWTGLQLVVLWVAVDNLLLDYRITAPARIFSEGVYHMLQAVSVLAVVMVRMFVVNYRLYLNGLDTLPETTAAAQYSHAAELVQG
jgi:hypothetical protein